MVFRMHLMSVVSGSAPASSRRCLPLRKAVVFVGMLAAFVFLVIVVAAPTSADAAQPSFLRSVEIRSANLSQFTRWTAVLDRSTTEAARAEHDTCRSAGAAACRYVEWLRFLGGLRNLSKWEQLVAVNGYINSRAYVPDDQNWGMTDYWATPGEFLARSGDCEDFAITKFYSLKRLGWTDEEMRIAAVKDLQLGVGHAILVVYFAGRAWLLDNQHEQVTDLETVRHYEPVFSINESHWWLHKSNEKPGKLVLTVGSKPVK